MIQGERRHHRCCPRRPASPVVSLRTSEGLLTLAPDRISAALTAKERGYAEMKTIATPAAIAARVEEASKDAVARCFVSINS